MFLSSFKIARGIPGSPLPVPMSRIFLFCFKCSVKAIASSIASSIILSVFFFEIRLCLLLKLIVASLKSFILSLGDMRRGAGDRATCSRVPGAPSSGTDHSKSRDGSRIKR